MTTGKKAHIGACRCPVCGSNRAKLGCSAAGLAYVTCNACNCQVFSRSGDSDEKLRALHIPAAGSPTEPPAAPAPAAKAAPPKAAPAAPQQTPPAPAPKRAGWGLLT